MTDRNPDAADQMDDVALFEMCQLLAPTPDWLARVQVYQAEDGTYWASDNNGLFATGDNVYQLATAVREAATMLGYTHNSARMVARAYLAGEAPDEDPRSLILALLAEIQRPPTSALVSVLEEIANDVAMGRIRRRIDPGVESVPYAGNPNQWIADAVSRAAAFIEFYGVPDGPNVDGGIIADPLIRLRIKRLAEAVSIGNASAARDHANELVQRLNGYKPTS